MFCEIATVLDRIWKNGFYYLKKGTDFSSSVQLMKSIISECFQLTMILISLPFGLSMDMTCTILQKSDI